MQSHGISQMPVTDGKHIVGSLNESNILQKLIETPDVASTSVKDIMGKPFIFVGLDNSIDALASLLDHHNKAVLVRDEQNKIHIITQSDLVSAVSK